MMKSLGYMVHPYWGHDLCRDLLPPFDSNEFVWKAMASRMIPMIQENSNAGDYLCLTGGSSQKPIADALPHLTAIEPSIGYGGVFTKFLCFQSYAWMHAVYGANAVHRGGTVHDANGGFYDTVIPNTIDPEEFPAGKGDGGYLLYIGRLIERKGVRIALEIAAASGLPIKVAGDGDVKILEGFKGDLEYLGLVKPKQRAELMGGAIATLVPTIYLEPFGTVFAESNATGTPVITTDFGGFTETVEHGVTGYRCHLLREFVQAVKDAPSLDRSVIREKALARFSTEVCKHQYDRWFQRLETIKSPESWRAA
jgi:glycosyltransferase involved in cell wall biosynthesis